MFQTDIYLPKRLFFLDGIKRPVYLDFFGPMKPLFGQYEYMFENLMQNIYMFETS